MSEQPTFVHPDTLTGDLIATLLPKVERYVAHHYHELSYDMQQDLIQAGITALWEKTRCDTPNSHPRAYWMGVCKVGIMGGLDALRRETGVWSKGKGTRIENRVEYACDLSTDGLDGLEVAERRIHRTPGPCDPDGGQSDQHMDFERLVTTAFMLLTSDEIEDCRAVALFLATGEGSTEAFTVAHDWTHHHYKKTLNRLKDVFHQADGRARPTGRPTPIDQEKVLDLYRQGYGYDRIARLIGCSKASVQSIITILKKEHPDIAAIPKRANQNTIHPHHRAQHVAA